MQIYYEYLHGIKQSAFFYIFILLKNDGEYYIIVYKQVIASFV